MKLEIVNNHILIDVNTNLGQKTCVVDTGSPLTFFFDNVTRYNLANITHNVSPLNRIAMHTVQKEDIENLIGTQIGGFIGSDSFIKFGDVFLDLHNKEINFGEINTEIGNPIPMETIMGVPKFNVSFNGKELMTAFDTGAMYSIISSQYANEIELSPTHSTINDYHPGYGAFKADTYYGNINVGNKNLGSHIVATAQHYDSVLNMMGVSAFIGIDTLEDCSILLSYGNEEVCIRKNQ